MFKTSLIYNLIYDPQQVRDFSSLIGQGTHQIFLSSFSERIPKTFLNNSPEIFLNKLKSYEISTGAYCYNDSKLTEKDLKIYSTTNPIDPKKAVKKYVLNMIEGDFSESSISDPVKSLQDSLLYETDGNLFTVVNDCKHETSEILEFLSDRKINCILIDTKYTHHILLSRQHSVIVSQKFAETYQVGDVISLIPGTYEEGDFKVRFVDKRTLS